MANRRNFKKEINNLQEEMIFDCMSFLNVNKKQSEENVADIISEMLDVRETVFTEISKPTSKMARKEVKERYGKIASLVINNLDTAYEKLSKLPRD